MMAHRAAYLPAFNSMMNYSSQKRLEDHRSGLPDATITVITVHCSSTTTSRSANTFHHRILLRLQKLKAARIIVPSVSFAIHGLARESKDEIIKIEEYMYKLLTRCEVPHDLNILAFKQK